MDDALNAEWLSFKNNTICHNNVLSNDYTNKTEDRDIPKSNELYISTQTKIAYLNIPINIYELFWELPVIKYYTPKEGVIKKSIKINSINNDEVNKLENKIKNIENINMHILNQINEIKGKKHTFKDVRKIDIGLCSKDIRSYRKKTKGAFYNCFALILRVLYNNIYKEIHIKVFNTGKLEIPGIQNNDLLILILNKLVEILQPFTLPKLIYNKDTINTVLINSNFNCGYFIKRNILYNRLKYHYKLHALYDPCSYPGIQCKFYYNPKNKNKDGICKCKQSCNFKKKKKIKYENKCIELSFMIFRTGSVLIVGNCDMKLLRFVYNYLVELFVNEYKVICDVGKNIKKVKAKKNIKKKVLLFN